MGGKEPGLKRSVTLPQLLFYGLGTMVGGGIYALTGKVAGEAGMLAPASFLLAGLLALVNGCSFAELSSRIPHSAGEANYTQAAFGRRWLSTTVGWLVIATGVVSAGTLSIATVGFLEDLVSVPHTAATLLLVACLGLLAAWGIVESVFAVTVITVIEVGALVYIVVVGAAQLESLTARWPELVPGAGPGTLTGLWSGAFLGFYAFIGFEDMVNIGEEVRRPRRSLPLAIMLSVSITLVLYVAVTTIAVLAVDPEVLSASSTPLATVLTGDEAGRAQWLVIVSLLAGINGALVQIVMASRVIYGLAGRRGALRLFAKVGRRTRTPLAATLLATLIVAALTMWFPLITLARITSGAILIVFGLLNLSLWHIKRRGDEAPADCWQVPLAVPACGFLSCLTLLVAQLMTAD